ncbi:MAG: UPF0182 family protein, partial [Longimicrobiales bacterium]
MNRRLVRLLVTAGAGLLLGLVAARLGIELYTNALWYGSVGYSDVFWRRLLVSGLVQVVAAVVAAAIVLANLGVLARRLGTIQLRRRYGNLEIAEQVPRGYLRLVILVVAALSGWWLAAVEFGGGAGIDVLAWARRVDWNLADPLFGHDLSFYVFSLPLYARVYTLVLLSVLWSLILVTAGYALLGMLRWEHNRPQLGEPARLHFVVLATSLLALLAIRFWLARYDVLLNGTGVREAVGYTDVTARLPARAALAGLALVA